MHFNLPAVIPHLFAILTHTFLFSYIFSQRSLRSTPQNRSFLVLTTLLGWWSLCDLLCWLPVSEQTATMVFRFSALSWMLVGYFFSKFSHAVVNIRFARKNQFLFAIIVCFYVVNLISDVVFAGAIQTWYGKSFVAGRYHSAAVNLTSLPILYSLWLLLTHYRKSTDTNHKRTILLIITGSSISLIISLVFNVIVPTILLKYHVYQAGAVSTVILAFTVFTAAVRYNFLTVERQAIHEAAGTLFQDSLDAVIILDSHRQITDINIRARELFKLDKNDSSYESTVNSSSVAVKEITGLIPGYQYDHVYKGEEIFLPRIAPDCTISLSQSDIIRRGIFMGKLLIIREITEKKKQEREMLRLIYRDGVTGSFNRIAFHKRLTEEITARTSTEENKPAAVLIIRLARFRNINETLGEAIGDAVIKTISQKITDFFKVDDIVFRTGGSEFAIILTIVGNENEALRITEKLSQILQTPVVINSYMITIDPVMGISLFPKDGTTADELITGARTAAAFLEKEEKRYGYLKRESSELLHTRIRVEQCMRHALSTYADKEFFLVYQPQIRTDGTICGAEALLRWQSAELGFVSPGVFIPIAEETGMITDLGEWVLRKAAGQIAQWNPTYPGVNISVNISPRQFRQHRFEEFIHTIVTDSGILPQQLQIEITESGIMVNTAESIQKLQKLKDMGYTLHIDDFGTGYSSFSTIKDFPVHTIKIDKSFIDGILTDPRTADLIKALINMSRTLGLSVIAEGVETAEQRDFLFANGCGCIQGYFYSKPLAADAFIVFFANHQKFYPGDVRS